MSDTLYVSAGGYDGYYGNYGGTGVAPTTYNPYGLGSPAATTYYAAATASPNLSVVTDPLHGRVPNNVALTVTAQNGSDGFTSGLPADLLQRADDLVSKANSENSSYAGKLPGLLVQNGTNATVAFSTAQDFKNYLARSVSYLVPPDTLAATFSQTLGRAASSDDITNLENAINAGASVSTVKWAIAHTPEAQVRLNGIYNDTLNRGIDGPSIQGREDELGGSSLAAVRVDLAHSQEALSQLNLVYD